MTGEDILIWFTRALVGASATGLILLLKWQRETNTSVAVMRHDLDEVKGRDGGAPALAARLDKLEAARAEHSERIAVIRTDLNAAPGHEDLQRLHDRISKLGDAQTEMQRDIATALEGIKGIRTAVDRLHDHHLTGEARA